MAIHLKTDLSFGRTDGNTRVPAVLRRPPSPPAPKDLSRRRVLMQLALDLIEVVKTDLQIDPIVWMQVPMVDSGRPNDFGQDPGRR